MTEPVEEQCCDNSEDCCVEAEYVPLYSTKMFEVTLNAHGNEYDVTNTETGVTEFRTTVLVQAMLTADQLEKDTSNFFRDKKNESFVANEPLIKES